MQNDPTKISGATVAVGAPEPFQQLSQPTGVQFLLQGLQPPSRVYIGVDDQLSVTLKSARQNLSCTLAYRILRTDGLIIPFVQTFFFTPPVNQNIQQPLTEGFLLSLDVTVNGGSVEAAGYCRIDIARQATSSNPQIYDTLISGYLSTMRGLSYPETPPARGSDGRGAIVSITGTVPAPGADIVETVPTGRIWRFQSLLATFTASAAVASRTPSWVIDDGANAFYQQYAGVSPAASQAFKLLLSDNAVHANDGINVFDSTVPSNLILGPGMRIRTITTGIQAGDQWTAPQYLVEEWQTQ